MNKYFYETYLDISGYQYEVRVEYGFPFNDFEVMGLSIKNDTNEWVDFPYLAKVEQELEDELREKLQAEAIANREERYSLYSDWKRGL